jgi:hypothetical protein
MRLAKDGYLSFQALGLMAHQMGTHPAFEGVRRAREGLLVRSKVLDATHPTPLVTTPDAPIQSGGPGTRGFSALKASGLELPPLQKHISPVFLRRDCDGGSRSPHHRQVTETSETLT